MKRYAREMVLDRIVDLGTEIVVEESSTSFTLAYPTNKNAANR